MNILVIGTEDQLAGSRKKFGAAHNYVFLSSHPATESHHEKIDIILDFLLDEDPYAAEPYKNKNNLPVFVNAPKLSLAEISFLFNNDLSCKLFGFNGLPEFLERPLLEVSLLEKSDKSLLESLCNKLGTAYQIVEDRVGMVTPRVISMIINEAYYTLQEGTASAEDIDKGMKLGTAYPYGPLEWARKIGIKHVYELLEAIYHDTKDERYKVCPLLKKEYLLSNE